jgi:hypothetical protein
VGLTEEEFAEVALSHAVSPYRHDRAREKVGTKLHDFDEWFRREPMPRDEALRQLERWRKVNRNRSQRG